MLLELGKTMSDHKLEQYGKVPTQILKQDSAITQTRVCREERGKLNIQPSLQAEKEIDSGCIHGCMRIFAV